MAGNFYTVTSDQFTSHWITMADDFDFKPDWNTITDGLNRLGYDKTLRGARAFNDETVGWQNCFLALAYGEIGQLRDLISNGANPTRVYQIVSRELGLRLVETEQIVWAFDHFREEFKNLVTKWLLNPDNQKRVPEPWAETILQDTPPSQNGTLSGTETQEAPSHAWKDAPVQYWTIAMGEGFLPVLKCHSTSLPTVPSTSG